jgi:hypothetical protein
VFLLACQFVKQLSNIVDMSVAETLAMLRATKT